MSTAVSTVHCSYCSHCRAWSHLTLIVIVVKTSAIFTIPYAEQIKSHHLNALTVNLYRVGKANMFVCKWVHCVLYGLCNGKSNSRAIRQWSVSLSLSHFNNIIMTSWQPSLDASIWLNVTIKTLKNNISQL